MGVSGEAHRSSLLSRNTLGANTFRGDLGMSEAYTHADWKAHVDAIILDLAIIGKPFTVEDVRREQENAQRYWVQKLPEPHPNAWGGRFLFAQREGVIQPNGWCHSTRRTRHRSAQRLWEGC